MTEKQITRWTWTARILALLGLIAGVLAAADKLPEWCRSYAAIGVALMGIGHGWIRGFLPAVKSRVLPVALLLLAVAVMASGCTPGIAWRTLDAVQHARTLTAQQLAAVGHTKHRACLATHGPQTDGYRVCIEPTRAMLRHWQREARPVIIAAVQITASSLQIAEKVQSDKAVKWLELIKPAICALARVVKLFKVYLPDGGASILSVVAMAEGVSCER